MSWLIPHGGYGTKPPATVSHTATGAIQGTNATVFTFSGLDIYDSVNARKVVVTTGGQGGAAGDAAISGITVGGAACSLVVAAGTGAETNGEMWYIDLDNSTTAADVVVTWNTGDKGNCAVDIFAVEKAASGTASQSLSSTASPGTNDLDISANGVAIAGWFVNTGSGSAKTVAWVGLTEVSDQWSSGEQVLLSSSKDAFTTAQTNLTISGTCSGATTATRLVMAAFDSA